MAFILRWSAPPDKPDAAADRSGVGISPIGGDEPPAGSEVKTGSDYAGVDYFAVLRIFRIFESISWPYFENADIIGLMQNQSVAR